MILPGQMYCMHQLNLRPNLMEPVPWSCSNSIGPSQPRHLARHTHNHKYMHTHSGRVQFCSRTGQFPCWKVYPSSRSWHPLADKILILWIYWRCWLLCSMQIRLLVSPKCNWRSRKVHLVSLEVHCISSHLIASHASPSPLTTSSQLHPLGNASAGLRKQQSLLWIHHRQTVYSNTPFLCSEIGGGIMHLKSGYEEHCERHNRPKALSTLACTFFFSKLSTA